MKKETPSPTEFGNYDVHEVVMLDDGKTAMLMSSVEDAGSIFDNGLLRPIPIPGDMNQKYLGYVPWGVNNQMPYDVMNLVRQSEIMSQNKQFNTLTCYGSGLTYLNSKGEKIDNPEVKNFFRHNRPARYLLEQSSDMKHFLFTISVIILSKDGSKITNLVHKESCYIRFETCNPKTGEIEHVFYANWEYKAPLLENVEVIDLLDISDPIGDLEIRVGRAPNTNGTKKDSGKRKFAILNYFPTVGNKYYPIPPYFSVFRSGWYNSHRLIATGKEAKLRHHASIKYHVEISRDYWNSLLAEEKITDPKKRDARIKLEKQNIRDFITGIENSNKMWISGFYTNTQGKEVQMIRITAVDTGKEGGDWLEDSEEASNIMCYADNVHPDLVGATPGKSKGGFSGTDKRELFTMKQSMEKPYHDILLEPYNIIADFNGWDDVVFDIPIITLTSLDTGNDSQPNTMNNMAAGAAMQQQQQTQQPTNPS
jgi:hypothetical protein